MIKARQVGAAVVAAISLTAMYLLQSDGDDGRLAERAAAERSAGDAERYVDQLPGATPTPKATAVGAPLPIPKFATPSAVSTASGSLGHTVGAHANGERPPIRIAELDALLDANEGEFREREQDMHTELSKLLEGDPVTQSMEVRCADGFCRLKMDKPVNQGMAWDKIDVTIAPVTRGEMIFGAEPNGDERSTAVVYFSQDSHLPMAAAVAANDEE